MRRSLLLFVCLSLVIIAAPAHAAGSIVVNTNADNTIAGDDLCTLREAIANANADADTTNGDCATGSGADTITFDVSTDGTPITLSGSELPIITTNVTITGDGAANTLIQASACNPVTLPGGCTPATYRVFEVGSTGSLSLSGLSVLNGNCPSSGSTCSTDPTQKLRGGGVYNAGSLTFTNVHVSQNYAVIGGGISNTGSMTIDSSTISDNTAQAYAGGIYDDSGSTLMVLNNSLVSGNQATQSGGGIAHFSAGAVTIDHSTIADNKTAAGGGGIYQSGGTLTIQNGTTISANSGSGIQTYGSLTVRNGSMIGGTSPGSGNTSSGILGETGSTILVDHSSVDGNTGTGIYAWSTLTVQNGSVIGEAGAGNGGANITGGGILVESGTATIDASTVSYNTGLNAGGGIFVSLPGTTLHVQHGSLIAHNTSLEGGGINNYGGTTVIDASTISDNMAVTQHSSPGEGGGIYNFGATLTVQNGSVIKDNTADADGGGIINYATTSANTATITDSCIVGNSDGSGLALLNQMPETQTATGDWWGDPGGPNVGTADKTSGAWDTSGFLSQPTIGCGGGPINLSAASGGAATINLTWTDNAGDESGYTVERSSNGTTGWA